MITEGLLLLLYVDDIIITGSNRKHVSEVVAKLGREFSMKDLGPLHFFLGIKVKYFLGGLHLSQGKYAAELLNKTDMIRAKAINTPLAQKHSSHEAVGSPVDASLYRRIMGSLP